MKTSILAMGHLTENFFRDACSEYQKRLSRTWPLAITELDEVRLPGEPSAGEIGRALAREAELLRAKIPSRAYKIALCVEGVALSSEGLSEKMDTAAARGYSEIVFLIGSSFGLDESLKGEADLKLSLSKMTLPHALARVVLCEQIYRAAEIARGSRYHK